MAIKILKIPCTFGGTKAPVAFYLGSPNKESHPIHFQAEWLSKERGGTVPEEIMNSLEELQKLSIKNGVPFIDLCSYALEAIQADNNAINSSNTEKIEKKHSKFLSQKQQNLDKL